MEAPMPTPHPSSETRDDFIERCVPIVLEEGTAENPDQAVAICSAMWREATKGPGTMNQQLDVKLEIKALSKREFEGHGSTFGNVDLGDDIVMPGAFKRSLAEHRKGGVLPQMFWMHRPEQVPGKWLEMQEDSKGLLVKGVLAETPLGDEMHTLLQMKAVRGLSIGFRTKDQDFDKDGHRLLKEVDLWEVSLVSLAMNPLAQVSAMKSRLSSDGEYVPTEREFEQRLREVGCSRNVARFLIARIFDDGPGGMPVDHRWDAGNVDKQAEEDLLKSIDEMQASMLMDILKL
jgi:Escherichia/Staphylococcus phage prohead protease